MNKIIYTYIGFLKIMRPYQWIKNSLVFIPMIMAHNINLHSFLESALAFLILSFVASSIYIINDIVDIKSDRLHPQKKFRPLAAETITLRQSKFLILVLIFFSILLMMYTNKNFHFLVIGYFGVSNLYTFVLKKYIIIDIFVLSSLYIMRIIGGGLITDINVSIWLISFSFFFFLSLATIKRHAELINIGKSNQEILHGRGYSFKNLKMVSMLSKIFAITSIFIFVLYLNSSQVINLYSTPEVLWIVCLILLYWISRILFISNKGKMNDDPIIFAIYDKISYFCVALILFFYGLEQLYKFNKQYYLNNSYMNNLIIKKISGWGGYPVESVKNVYPKDIDEIFKEIKDSNVIARGNGRAYGDSAQNVEKTINMMNFNKILSFDSKSGLLEVEAGVLLKDVINTFLPQGWFPYVTPGSKFISIGGLISADVHGKNHHKEGSFRNYVEWIDLISNKKT